MDAHNARRTFNFSEWRAGDITAAALERAIRNGSMPLPQYLWMHPEARLTDAEKEQLIKGLYATLGTATPTPPTTAPASDGAALVQARCTACHGLARDQREKDARAVGANSDADGEQRRAVERDGTKHRHRVLEQDVRPLVARLATCRVSKTRQVARRNYAQGLSQFHRA